MLTFGSLFAGIGGMDLGLERSGMRCLWQVEIEPWCRKVLAKHWPDVERFEDVREVGRHNLRAVDLVCGGFPCQPVSCAGKQKGEADERWLWPEFARVVRELRPRWVLGENVPGLLSVDAGRLFGGVLRDLAESGYVVEWDCIPAAAVGAPHIRDRVFIVGHANQPSTHAFPEESSPRGPACESSSRPTDVADATVFGWEPRWTGDTPEKQGGGEPDRSGILQNLADANRQRRSYKREGLPAVSIFGCVCAGESNLRGRGWPVEPDVGRVAHGVPSRVDRLRGLGNAVVPAVAEFIGKRIVEADEGMAFGVQSES